MTINLYVTLTYVLITYYVKAYITYVYKNNIKDWFSSVFQRHFHITSLTLSFIYYLHDSLPFCGDSVKKSAQDAERDPRNDSK